MSYWLNRTLCDVLEEMRLCVKTLNFASMLGMIEEAQYMGNRMESAIEDQKDFKRLRNDLSILRNKHESLQKEIEALETKKQEKETPND